MKFLDDSASFLLEKLKNHIILAQNPNILLKIKKNLEKYSKILGFLGFPMDSKHATFDNKPKSQNNLSCSCPDLSSGCQGGQVVGKNTGVSTGVSTGVPRNS